jgi:hypothetical protein
VAPRAEEGREAHEEDVEEGRRSLTDRAPISGAG